MADIATPNLPSRSFEKTQSFYKALGFDTKWCDDEWLILESGSLVLEFFPHPNIDPATSWFSCCLRFDDVDAFYSKILSAGIDEKATGWPRAHPPKRESWGGYVGALIDPDGTLLRLISKQSG